MATINEIKQQAEAVKNATQVGENTAMRVGGALSGLADIAKQQDTELGKKFDKESVVQELGDAEDKVMSQKATTNAIADETKRAKAAEEAIIFDVSVYNNGTVFESLQALLSNSNLSTLIPISVRHGGMTIRFVQSSDNKYVQYRLMNNNWSTTISDWQGVDNEPTAGSDNLVKSGGVKAHYNFVENKEQKNIQCVAGQEILKLDSLIPFSIKTGEKYKVHLEDTNNILSGNTNLYEEYSDGTIDTFGLTPNYTVNRTASKDIIDIFVYIHPSVVSNSGIVILKAEQLGTMSTRVSDLESQMSSVNENITELNEAIEKENEKINSLTNIVIGANETKETNVIVGQEILFDIPMFVEQGEKYSVSFSSGNCLSVNPVFFINYKDGTELHFDLNRNQEWYERTAEKDTISFSIYVGGSNVINAGNVTFSVKTENIDDKINKKIDGKIDDIKNVILSDNDHLNACVSALYIPSKRAGDISSIRAVKAGITGSLFYNALYIFFKDNTNIAIFTDSLYRTEQEAVTDCIGIRGSINDGGYACIDYSSLNVGTTQFDNINIVSDISSVSTFNTIYSVLYGNTGWKDNGYTLNLIEDVICIGDSITEGNIYDSPYHFGVVNRLSYPSQLAKMTGWNVTNAGKSGITTIGWWEEEFSKYNYANYKLAIIYLGTNGGLTDTMSTDAPSGTDYHNYADTNTGRLCSIIEGIKAQNPNILMAIIIGSNLQASEDIPTIKVIKQAAERYGMILLNLRETIHFRLIDDKYHGYANVGDPTFNYTHYNAAGYLTMAKAIKEYLSEWFDNNIKSVSNVAY